LPDLSIAGSTGPEPMEKVRKEYLRLRNQQRAEQEKPSKSTHATS